MKREIIAILVSGLFISCAVSPMALVKNPTTGEVRECRVDPLGDFRRKMQVRQCVEQYEKAGWVEVK